MVCCGQVSLPGVMVTRSLAALIPHHSKGYGASQVCTGVNSLSDHLGVRIGVRVGARFRVVMHDHVPGPALHMFIDPTLIKAME